MQSTMGDNTSTVQRFLSHEDYMRRLNNKQGSLSSLVLYYEGHNAAVKFLDNVSLPSSIIIFITVVI